MFLSLLPFHFVSCRHSMSMFLHSIKFANSFPLPVIVPIFKVPTFMSVHLPFHSSCCLFTDLLPLFLLFFALVFTMFSSSIIFTGAVLQLRWSLVIWATTDSIWIHDHNAFVCLAKVLCQMPFLLLPSPFIQA